MLNKIKFRLFFLIMASGCWGLCLFSSASKAEVLVKAPLKIPANIEADKMDYDKLTAVVTATGEVKIVQGNRNLFADKIVYNQIKNSMEATGKIKLEDENGDTFYGDKAYLDNNMNTGSITNLSANLLDDSTAKADYADIKSKEVVVLKNSFYTACLTCINNKNIPAFWSIKAKSTKFDDENQTVTHTNAFFQVYDVPVAYFPYFKHPTPHADRKSGFLVPKYKNSTIFGVMVSTPFYYSIAPDKDVVITPIFTTKENMILESKYRQMVESGNYEISTSITRPKKVDNTALDVNNKATRGYIRGRGNFNINNDWDWEFDGARTTDDTFLHKYYNEPLDILRSTASTTYIHNQNYTTIRALSFQSLNINDDPGLTPFVLPYVTSHWQGPADDKGRYFSLDSNLLALDRREDNDTIRGSVKASHTIPFVSEGGHLFELKNSIRADAYKINNAKDPVTTQLSSYDKERAIPQAELNWRLPMINAQEKYRSFIEPIASIIVSPYSGNSDKIINEDSQSIEFSDVNLFNASHFSGLDLIEEGPRANYGLKTSIDHNDFGYTTAMVGQSYKIEEDHNFDERSGLRDNRSDIVGRISHSYQGIFDIAYQFRLDKDNFVSKKNLIHAGLNEKKISVYLDYLATNQLFDQNNSSLLTDQNNRKFLTTTTELRLVDDWVLGGYINRDVEVGAWRSVGSKILFKGQCVTYTLGLDRDFTTDRDAKENTSISFLISLKNLTE